MNWNIPKQSQMVIGSVRRASRRTCVDVAGSADGRMDGIKMERSLKYEDYFPRTLASAVIKGELTRKDDILALLIR